MKVNVVSITKTELRKKELPEQFNEEIRVDIIKRAALAIQSHNRQPYGTDPRAGKMASAELSRRRHKYRGSYGFGISRVPRKILSRRGTRMYWVGAIAPGTVGGRRAHPPKAEKKWSLKINKKERRKAIRSALTATMIHELVEKRGHIIPKGFPFIIENKIEGLGKSQEVKNVLEKLGLKDELARVGKKKVRAGKGKTRGRKYKRVRGILIVVSDKCNLLKGTNNIPGVEVEVVNKLNAELLAPGINPGRFTLFTEAAIDRLEKEKLFTEEHVAQKEEKPKEGKTEKDAGKKVKKKAQKKAAKTEKEKTGKVKSEKKKAAKKTKTSKKK